MYIPIPRILKPLGWLLWKINIAERDIIHWDNMKLFEGERELIEGIDYKYAPKSSAVTFTKVPTEQITGRTKVLQARYFIGGE